MGIEGHRLEAYLRNAKSQVWHSLGSIGAFLRAKPDTTYVASEAQGSSASPHSEDSASEEIPVLHRLVIVYLMLPVVIWLVGWFEWWFGVPLALLVAVGVWQVLKPGQAKINRRTLLKFSAFCAAAYQRRAAAHCFWVGDGDRRWRCLR